jgi:uncharacterized protein YndB with AHSA1/START domain/DNA-binding transcriptional ArsR family regulator
METVFRALSHPSRRALLDLLRGRDGQTLSELDAHLSMTRFGTMKHLRVLERAGLVATRRVGREKLHYLNPVPIRLIHDRWIRKYAEPLVGALGALKRGLEGAAMDRPSHVYEVIIHATPEKVWEAITRPEMTRQYFYGTLVASDWKPGSPLAYSYPDGRPAAEGTVLEVDAPRRLKHTFSAVWDESVKGDAPHTMVWSLTPMGAATKLVVESFDFAGETATLQAFRGGMSVIVSGLKTLLETGQPLPIGG